MKSSVFSFFLVAAAVVAVSAAPASSAQIEPSSFGTIESPSSGQVVNLCEKLPFTITDLPDGAINIAIDLDRDDTKLNFIRSTPTKNNAYVNPEGLRIPIAIDPSPFANNMTGTWNVDVSYPGFQGGLPILKGPSTQIVVIDHRPCPINTFPPKGGN